MQEVKKIMKGKWLEGQASHPMSGLCIITQSITVRGQGPVWVSEKQRSGFKINPLVMNCILDNK